VAQVIRHYCNSDRFERPAPAKVHSLCPCQDRRDSGLLGVTVATVHGSRFHWGFVCPLHRATTEQLAPPLYKRYAVNATPRGARRRPQIVRCRVSGRAPTGPLRWFFPSQYWCTIGCPEGVHCADDPAFFPQTILGPRYSVAIGRPLGYGTRKPCAVTAGVERPTVTSPTRRPRPAASGDEVPGAPPCSPPSLATTDGFSVDCLRGLLRCFNWPPAGHTLPPPPWSVRSVAPRTHGAGVPDLHRAVGFLLVGIMGSLERSSRPAAGGGGVGTPPATPW